MSKSSSFHVLSIGDVLRGSTAGELHEMERGARDVGADVIARAARAELGRRADATSYRRKP